MTTIHGPLRRGIQAIVSAIRLRNDAQPLACPEMPGRRISGDCTHATRMRPMRCSRTPSTTDEEIMVSGIPRRPAWLIGAACWLCAVVSVFALGTSHAAASTLAYVEGGAVWVSAPDGSDAHEVSAGLSYPALTDDGTVYALAGSDQVAVLPPGVPEKPSIAIVGAGAKAMSVSPDGSELAWGDVQEGLNDIQDGLSVLRVADGRRTDILSDRWPVWFSNTDLTMGGPNGGDLFDASTDQEHQAIWPAEYATAYDTTINQYAIDRSGTRGAANMDITTRGGPPPSDPNAHTLVVFPVANAAPAVPTTQFCVVDGSQAHPIEISDITWSPDGSTLAWQEPDGIHEVRIPSTGNCPAIPGSQLVIPGGSEPSWGPSDDRRFPEPTAPPPGPGPKPQPTPTAQKLTLLSLPHRLTAAAFVKHGLSLRVTVPVTGTLRAAATIVRSSARAHHLPEATVGSGTAQVKHAGAVTLILRSSKRDSKRLRRTHSLPLTITLRINSLHTVVHFTLG
jgi:hypothetical protein